MRRRAGFHLEHAWTRRRIDAYVGEELSERDRARAEGHVSECPECGRIATSLRRVLQGLTTVTRRRDGRRDVAPGVVARLREAQRRGSDGEGG